MLSGGDSYCCWFPLLILLSGQAFLFGLGGLLFFFSGLCLLPEFASSCFLLVCEIVLIRPDPYPDVKEGLTHP